MGVVAQSKNALHTLPNEASRVWLRGWLMGPKGVSSIAMRWRTRRHLLTFLLIIGCLCACFLVYTSDRKMTLRGTCHTVFPIAHSI